MDYSEAIGYLLAMGAMCYNLSAVIVKVVHKVSKRRKAPKPRRFWVNPLNTVRRRQQQGDHFNLIREMRHFDQSRFVTHLRMTPKIYDKLLRLVTPHIEKHSHVREPIDPGTRLEITLRYLASGESCISLANQFRVGRSTVPKILDETLHAIYMVLKDLVLKEPTREDFENTAEGFMMRWNFPNCVGAIDGKHIAMVAPPNSGSKYYTYKHFHSIVLLAVCDYRYRFTMVDVGSPGRQSDGGVFRDCNFGKRFARNLIDLPEPTKIRVDGPKLPYYLVGDEAFGLSRYMQRPYPGRTSGTLAEGQQIFNYRLSRARRVVENSFGILAMIWRIFRQPIQASKEKVEAITLAAVCLHNFLLMEESDTKPSQRTYLKPKMVDRYENGCLIPGDWRNDAEPIHRCTFNACSSDDFEFEKSESENEVCEEEELSEEEEETLTNQTDIRAELNEYFMTSGRVKLQFSQNIY